MRSPIPVRPIEAAEHDAFLDVAATAMGHAGDEQWRGAQRLTAELDRATAAFDGDELVGSAQGVSFAMSVPGGDDVATAGIKAVGVLPTHRRRGILTALMESQLAQARQRGEALSVLWPTESAIYPRFGYAPGTAAASYSLQLGAGAGGGATAFLPGVDLGDGRARLVPAGKAAATVRPAYEWLRRQVPGMWARTDAWWERWSLDLAGTTKVVVIDSPGEGVVAYARYSITSGWGATGPANDLHVGELLAHSPAAAARLWRYLLDIDLVASVTCWHRPPDDPLPWLLANSRLLERRLRDGAWLRILDVPAALAARRYRQPTSVVLAVADPQIPENSGRWRLDGGPDGATCTRTDAPADISAGIGALSAAYLGGWSLADLAAAGRVVGSPEAIAAADAAFTWRPHPWAVTWF